ncbi:MAG: N-acetylmuramoyl-L-alanine amidase [Candidatus Methylomirabilales bacterium]
MVDRFRFLWETAGRDLGRVKSRIIRELVKDNIDTIQGRRPGVPPHPLLRISSRALAWVSVSLTLVAASYSLSNITEAPQAITSPAPSLPPAVEAQPPSLAQTASANHETSLPAPQPIDRAVLPLGVQKIVLDPGHGGTDSGTIAPGGIVEKEITLDIGHRLRRLLEKASFEVAMTRKTDKAVSLKERVGFANAVRGDLFVSIHINWIKTRKTRGVETYYLGPTDDPYLTRLTAMENEESGYSLTDYRGLVEAIYMDVRNNESHRLALAVQWELFRSLRKINPEVKNRGVKKAPFIVLVGTRMPAILAEVSCLSNEKEARLLARPAYRQRIAEALFGAIHSYADSLTQTDQKGA